MKIFINKQKQTTNLEVLNSNNNDDRCNLKEGNSTASKGRPKVTEKAPVTLSDVIEDFIFCVNDYFDKINILLPSVKYGLEGKYVHFTSENGDIKLSCKDLDNGRCVIYITKENDSICDKFSYTGQAQKGKLDIYSIVNLVLTFIK